VICIKPKTLTPAVIAMIILAAMPVTSVLSSRDEDILTFPYSSSGPPEKDDLNSTLEQIVDKIYNSSDPSKDIFELLSYPEIKELIIDFSDEETLGILETVFSENNRLIKRQQMIKYNNKIQKERQKDTFQEFENELNLIISSEIFSLKDIENFEFISKLNISKENIMDGYNEWINYLDEHPRFKSALQDNDMNWQLFALTILIWGFFLTGSVVAFSTAFSSCIMFIEACVLGTFFGTISGGTFGVLLTVWEAVALDGFLPLVGFLKAASESKLISNIPTLAELLNISYLFLEDLIEYYIQYSFFVQPFLIAGKGSMASIIMFSTFIKLWNNQWIVRFLGGGTVFALGWLIIYFLFKYLLSENKINLNTFPHCFENSVIFKSFSINVR
jgi:hypothetical protein